MASENSAIEEVLAVLDFEDGLITAVAQDAGTSEILMVAHMNEEAVRRTLASGEVTYWSRSRDELWRKGEQSGQTQALVEMRLDCDGDAVILLVEPAGVACHTGRRSCFFRAVKEGGIEEILEVEIDPQELYESQ